MKKLVALFMVLAVATATVIAQDEQKNQFAGTWNISGNLPSKTISFLDNDICVFKMRDGSTAQYNYKFEDKYVMIGTQAYLYEVSSNKIVLTPAFGEDGIIITLIKKV